MHITFIATFVPRKCGIATYTKDLTDSLHKRKIDISLIAMENPQVPTTYTKPVITVIAQNERDEYIEKANQINRSHTDLVHIQHEFGIFGGNDGEYILELVRLLTKPCVVTLHTVLITPSGNQKYIIQELSRLCRRVTVMDEIARERLVRVYNLNPRDILMMAHGAPPIKMTQAAAKKQLGLTNVFVVLVNNLLSRNKGIEYAIEAVAQSVKIIPHIQLLVVGETHPLVKIGEGESYREELEALVKMLQMEAHVIFRNEYVPLQELTRLLAAADIYITPYLDPEQITSGTLTYALNAGKVCIATEYIYAKQMLSRGRGILVPFRDSQAIADALTDIMMYPAKRQQIEARAQTLSFDWRYVAIAHRKLYADILVKEGKTDQSMSRILRRQLDTRYLFALTDNSGIFQHAKEHEADLQFGYSTDDNGRALIVASQLDQNSLKVKKLSKTYVQFLAYAQEPDGAMHTFLSSKNTWLDTADISDAYGRAMWGMGFFLGRGQKLPLKKQVEELFLKGAAHIRSIRDARTACDVLLGLYYYLEMHASAALRAESVYLASLLMRRYREHQDATWQWFEDELTYDNYRFPQALLAAYLLTKNSEYKKTALKTLAFAEKHNFKAAAGYYNFVGQDGWLKKGQEKEVYDQQPLEAEGAVSANLFAWKVTGKTKYKKQAMKAFSWFLGNNRNHRALLDETSGGVHDGLTRRGVNLNQGAESVVSYLIALLSLKEASKNP